VSAPTPLLDPQLEAFAAAAAPLSDPRLQAFTDADPGVLRPLSAPVTAREKSRLKIGLEISVAFYTVARLVRTAMDEIQHIGRPHEMARLIWEAQSAAWLSLATPPVREALELGEVTGLTAQQLDEIASSYAEGLGTYLDVTSADALTDGVNRQVNQRWDLLTAWKRASAAYGLDKRAMGAYLVTALSTAGTGSVDIVGRAARLFADKALLERAELIGRTEAHNVTESGKALSWLYLQRRGGLPPNAAREWDTSGGESVCATCRPLNGVQAPLDTPFQTAVGQLWAPQAHLGCTCTIRLVVPEIISKAAAVAAGLCVRARDTGRVLMLQRGLSPRDAAGGRWEFPGGHIDDGENPVAAAIREWSEETGHVMPRGRFSGSWSSGIYRGFVFDIAREKMLDLGDGRSAVNNPDNPDGDLFEAVAWWDPDLLARNPALRDELRAALPKLREALGGLAKADVSDELREPAGNPHGGRFTTAVHEAVAEPETEVETEAQTVAMPGFQTAVAEPGTMPGFAAQTMPGFATQAMPGFATAPQTQSLAGFQASPFAAPAPSGFAPQTAALPGFAPAMTGFDPAVAAATAARMVTAPSVDQRTFIRRLVFMPPPPQPPPRPDGRNFYMGADSYAVATNQHDIGKLWTEGESIEFSRFQPGLSSLELQELGVTAKAHTSPWDALDSPISYAIRTRNSDATEFMVDRSWQGVHAFARKIWDEAVAHPERYVADLSDDELMLIADTAGVEAEPGVDMESTVDSAILDNSQPLLDAYADYVTYHRFDLFGTDGEEMARRLNYAYENLGINFVKDPVQQVFVFDYGLHPDSRELKPALIIVPHGGYMLGPRTYRSAMRDRQSSPFRIGLRVSSLYPYVDTPAGDARLPTQAVAHVDTRIGSVPLGAEIRDVPPAERAPRGREVRHNHPDRKIQRIKRSDL
jgi:8-oxo-dGTP pyrophosphatase MutT (NUDIX family)